MVDGCWATVIVTADEYNALAAGDANWVQPCLLAEGHVGPHHCSVEDVGHGARHWIRWNDAGGPRSVVSLEPCPSPREGACVLFARHVGPHRLASGGWVEEPALHGAYEPGTVGSRRAGAERNGSARAVHPNVPPAGQSSNGQASSGHSGSGHSGNGQSSNGHSGNGQSGNGTAVGRADDALWRSVSEWVASVGAGSHRRDEEPDDSHGGESSEDEPRTSRPVGRSGHRRKESEAGKHTETSRSSAVGRRLARHHAGDDHASGGGHAAAEHAGADRVRDDGPQVDDGLQFDDALQFEETEGSATETASATGLPMRAELPRAARHSQPTAASRAAELADHSSDPARVWALLAIAESIDRLAEAQRRD